MTDSELQQKRFIAAAIDIGVAFGLGVVLWGMALILSLLVARSHSVALGYLPRLLAFAGSLVSLGYVLGRDIVAAGNSIGKKTQGLRVVTTAGTPFGFVDSAKRNAIFAIGYALVALSATLGLVPCIGDVVRCLLTPLVFLGLLASVIAAVVEIVKISQDAEGVRLGDAFAGTRVVR